MQQEPRLKLDLNVTERSRALYYSVKRIKTQQRLERKARDEHKKAVVTQLREQLGTSKKWAVDRNPLAILAKMEQGIDRYDSWEIKQPDFDLRLGPRKRKKLPIMKPIDEEDSESYFPDTYKMVSKR